ncbi:succinate dehydrogenase assembly factor 2 family protein [Marinihelvus fidelis]|uniref:FAD assembly factor SdhE n=1 Tax=Marinihelvus fidelis TaxID=2613842 RepID=A0A5N0TFC8_9GAMM|nr:succinate dehydrogenase assembly factor 2 [Marinihelvus fidelis]KAA9131959.1 succinate dehydrogenase assembly factor 2 family protein [Marinihelvus fidelis]
MSVDGPRRLSRLRWLTRRGMKELDVILEAFVLRESTALSDGAWPQFERFLQSEDDQLWDWLQGRDTPDEQAFRDILSALSQ